MTKIDIFSGFLGAGKTTLIKKLLKDTYGKGQLWTLAVPDNFPDLYKLPGKALTRIRREFPAGGVYLESRAGREFLDPQREDRMNMKVRKKKQPVRPAAGKEGKE